MPLLENIQIMLCVFMSHFVVFCSLQRPKQPLNVWSRRGPGTNPGLLLAGETLHQKSPLKSMFPSLFWFDLEPGHLSEQDRSPSDPGKGFHEFLREFLREFRREFRREFLREFRLMQLVKFFGLYRYCVLQLCEVTDTYNGSNCFCSQSGVSTRMLKNPPPHLPPGMASGPCSKRLIASGCRTQRCRRSSLPVAVRLCNRSSFCWQNNLNLIRCVQHSHPEQGSSIFIA